MKLPEDDIDVSAVGIGCLTSMGAGCVVTIIMMVLLVASGVQLAQSKPESIPIGIKLIGLLNGSATHVLGGFVTAKKAQQRKMFHALIVGGVLMLIGVAAFFYPTTRDASFKSFAPLTWLLTIPMCMWGAKLAIDAEDRSQ